MAREKELVDTLDLSAVGVAKARRLAAARGVAINAIHADALAWIAARTLRPRRAHLRASHRAGPARPLHAKALAALKPGGLIVLEAFRPEQSSVKRRARTAARATGLALQHCRAQGGFWPAQHPRLGGGGIPLSEGERHVGDSAVVRALVRRR